MFTNKKPNLDVQEFLQEWQLTEKSAERMAGVVLIFAAAALIALETASDQFTVLAAALAFAGGLTLIFRSRRMIQRQFGLRFASVDTQRNRAYMAVAGALSAVSMGAVNQRPLLLILGGLLGVLAGWFFWRAGKVQAYDALLQAKSAEDIETENDLQL
ncbi:MAG: hypothetical protein KC496_08665 [Anaerolineae bacterium]|nr:hypothetical protein [Anaerolineae bacterium]